MLISVIMSVYNAEEYLSEAIDSILSQNHKAFELIIVDDGSTDSSADIIRQYANLALSLFPMKKILAFQNR